MKRTRTGTAMTRRDRKLAQDQVGEYIERYHPEMANSTIVISPDGRFASVVSKPASPAAPRSSKPRRQA